MSEPLQVRISEGVGQRVRLAAALRRKRPGELVEEVLDAALPSNEEIAAQLTGPAGREGAATSARA
jgi:hypothetical protein